MKKICIVGLLAGICGYAQATTVSPPSAMYSTDSNGNYLEGSYAYAWGIQIPLSAGQTVTSFEIDFNNIKLTASGNGVNGTLYSDLLNTTTINQSSPYYKINKYEGDALGDYWQTTSGTSSAKSKYGVTAFSVLGSKTINLNATASWSYSSAAGTVNLTDLNNYLAGDNGILNIGFDPDCKFTVPTGGISVKYTVSVPDVSATAFLLALGLLSVGCFRRKFVPAKIQA
jgi:hypothetical protein